MVSFFLTLVFVKIDYDNLVSMLCFDCFMVEKNKNIDATRLCREGKGEGNCELMGRVEPINTFFLGLSLSLCDSIKYY